MIGNDIIDLSFAKLESNWQRRGFLEKQFSVNELAKLVITSLKKISINATINKIKRPLIIAEISGNHNGNKKSFLNHIKEAAINVISAVLLGMNFSDVI